MTRYQESRHSDDDAVDSFAKSMKLKLERKRAEGRGGWETCSAELLSRLLREHVEKGDPVDVANLAMMLHLNGQRIEPVKVLSDAIRRDATGETWMGMRVAAWEWNVSTALGELPHHATHWSTGPANAERLYRESDIRALLANFGQPAQPGKTKVFPVDVLDNPMREFQPGQWETAVWPSEAAQPSVGLCPICFEDEPHTGTCGSDDPKALCNRAAPVAAQSSVPVPNGWTLVPINPTKEMLMSILGSGERLAHDTAKPEYRATLLVMAGTIDRYAAMLAAAPTPSADRQAQQDADRDDSEVATFASAIIADRVADKAIAETVHAMFRSGNEIPVSRITITREQYETAQAKQGGQS